MKQLLCLIALLLKAVSVFADRGIAITAKTDRLVSVIGNGAYKKGPLKNPLNDANDMAAVLRRKGFAVSLLTEATQREMAKAIGQFGKRLRDTGIVLFFYAGHGLQTNGVAYLNPLVPLLNRKAISNKNQIMPIGY